LSNWWTVNHFAALEDDLGPNFLCRGMRVFKT